MKLRYKIGEEVRIISNTIFHKKYTSDKGVGKIGKIVDINHDPTDPYPYEIIWEDGEWDWFNEEDLRPSYWNPNMETIMIEGKKYNKEKALAKLAELENEKE